MASAVRPGSPYPRLRCTRRDPVGHQPGGGTVRHTTHSVLMKQNHTIRAFFYRAPSWYYRVMVSPLYDCFICHASEDKDAFVRPLAESLRATRVEVWYDEFSLKPGDSLRRSIDQGLSRSRFGVVILSPHFFAKNWTNWELDGLLQRQLYEPSPVILPIWHCVDRAVVAEYSPSLADKVAVGSREGIEAVVQHLLRAIRPEGSALIQARDMTTAKGLATPVISDDWWLDVIESVASQDWHRFAFPTFTFASSRGEQIGWAAMQMHWQDAAEEQRIIQTTQPDVALAFINAQPGLHEACMRDPRRLAETMPQLTIPGFGGDFESVFDAMHAKSRTTGEQRRACNDSSGSGLTCDGRSPVCDEEWALHDPDLGFYKPSMLACGFVQGFGAGLGPSTHGMPTIDYVLWFLSSASDWLPRRIHAYLLEGSKDWSVWPQWDDYDNQELGYHVEYEDSLIAAMRAAPGVRSFKLTTAAERDLRDRIALSVSLQRLPEDPGTLVHRFLQERFIQRWFASQLRHLRKRATRRRIG